MSESVPPNSICGHAGLGKGRTFRDHAMWTGHGRKFRQADHIRIYLGGEIEEFQEPRSTRAGQDGAPTWTQYMGSNEKGVSDATSYMDVPHNSDSTTCGQI